MADGRYGHKGAGGKIAHYYGDIVRDFTLGGAVVMLLAAPFYADRLRGELLFEVIGAIIIVGLAAMTNPWKKSILVADTIAAGIVTVVYQIWALNGYGTANNTAFILREAVSIIFMFAFYFSAKTVRAMVLHQIGKQASSEKFAGDNTGIPEKAEDPLSQIHHAFDEKPEDDDEENPPHKPTFYEKAG